MRLLNLEGQSFGELKALRPGPKKGNKTTWICLCSCGQEHIVASGNLVSGTVKTCGHTIYKLKRELKGRFISGSKPPAEYWVRANMLRRCLNSKHPQFNSYGGRGITVCAEWQASFETFYNDMGPRPSKKHSLERIDNEQGYSKENCCWALKQRQSANRRALGVSSTGVVGVRKQGAKFYPRIVVNYKEVYLGGYSTLKEAIEVREFVRLKYFGLKNNVIKI